ncbi:serine/threonine-protein kinase [Jatrophihabitans endophyticus]|uniref:serine/threonine-protein kinase n=1 Tax=Jatrophihabitans endophyticus TaxID=1206085 RepID=UPI0019FE9D0B|nr:serine/threonine-protein kinase [Jatrophihabitans endophyticus]MBE7189892.1 serine/threonine protein kinase [Jatrophihabitans endophyticus]
MNGIADYEFVRSLGRGNHGEYFVAATPLRLPVRDEYVAVKVLSGPTSEDVFRRATRELSAFAAVQSPYLVTLYDAGQQGSSFYYAMEYLDEGSLAAPAQGAAPPDRGRIITAVADAARAAHALHEAGIVHRDIKPGNVLLSRGRGKLADLGLSQVISPGVTMTGMGSVGAIEFTDPALVQGAKPSRATDIFSLGATLHRALAGVGFYGELPDDDAMFALRRVLSQPPTISSTLDPAVATAISWSIAPNAFDRPATALVFAEYLDSLV